VVPTTGRVTVQGYDTATAGAAVRRLVGFVFQNPDSHLVMPTVAEDLAFGLKAHAVPAGEHGARVDAVLQRLSIADLKHRACAELSGGEKQLVALAGALVLDPAILVCDEPTAMLDRRNARLFMDVVAALPQQVIVVSHHVEALESFERVVVLRAGQIAADGPAPTVIADYLRDL
jgi:biotin transport system ATP-binding protein